MPASPKAPTDIKIVYDDLSGIREPVAYAEQADT